MLLFSVLIFLVGSFSSTKSAIAFDEITCSVDEDCPMNTFCYMVSNLCAPCRTKLCSIHNRADSPWRKCHRQISDCGECLEGFEVEILTDGTPRDSCIPVSLPKQDKLSSKSENSMTFILVCGGVGALIILGIILVFTRRQAARYQPVVVPIPASFYENNSRNASSRDYTRVPEQISFIRSYCSNPYSYSTPILQCTEHLQTDTSLNKKSSSSGQVENIPLKSLSPSAPPYTAEPPVLYRSLENITSEKFQQAKPFRNANWMNEENSNLEGGQLEERTSEDIDEDDATDYESPSFLDENTMPSDWTPISTSVSEGASSCNTSNDESRTKRPHENEETLNSESESCNERKRMKPDENNDSESNELHRPFRYLGQEVAKDESSQIDDCSE